MKQNLITNINGVDIITVDHQGETYVPIKPICNAIGIDHDSQRNKLNADEFFNSTTAIIAKAGAAKPRKLSSGSDQSASTLSPLYSNNPITLHQ